MKKIITLLLVATMLACTSCGDKISDSDSSVKDSSGSASAAENSEPENSTDKSEEETAEENFWDFYGLNVLEPANLEKYGFSGELMWGRDAEATEELCFSIMSSMHYAERKGRDTGQPHEKFVKFY